METRILSEPVPENNSIDRLPKGFLLNSRFIIGEFLGEGGIAYNYVAEDMENGRTVVIKQTKRVQKITGKISEDRFQMEREYRILSELKSPNLPRTVDMFEIDNLLYVVREFRDGVLLTELMETGYTIEALENICWQILDILEYLHEKEIIYRDLKPSNILVDNNGRLFLLDFGTARYYHRGKKHDTICLGTPGFASPEQYGTAQTTQVSDIYSFGALIYYLITGEKPEDMPFEFATRDNIHKKIRHKSMAEFLCKCMEMSPAKRFQNIKNVRFVLFEGNIFKMPGLHQKKIFEICFNKYILKQMNFLEVACTIWLSIWLVCAAFVVTSDFIVEKWICREFYTQYDFLCPSNYYWLRAFKILHCEDGNKICPCIRQIRALKDLDLAIKFDQNNFEARYNRAGILSDFGCYDKAIKDVNKLIELDPHDLTFYMNLKKNMKENISIEGGGIKNGGINRFLCTCKRDRRIVALVYNPDLPLILDWEIFLYKINKWCNNITIEIRNKMSL